MKTSLLSLVIMFFLALACHLPASAQTETEFEDVILIDNKALTFFDFRALSKAGKHSEYEIIVKKTKRTKILGFEAGYILFYYYIENGELVSDWVHQPTEHEYDQFQYTWGPMLFKWSFYNSNTGKRSCQMARKFDMY